MKVNRPSAAAAAAEFQQTSHAVVFDVLILFEGENEKNSSDHKYKNWAL